MGFHGHYPSHIFQTLTKDTNFSKYLLIVDVYTKLPRIYRTQIITTEEVMDKP